MWRWNQDLLGRSGVTTETSSDWSSPILFRDYSRRGCGGVQGIEAGVGRSLPSERLVRFQQGIWWFRHGAKKGGHLGPIPQLEQLLSNLRLRGHSVGSQRLCNTSHYQLVVDTWTEHREPGCMGASSQQCSLVLECLGDYSTLLRYDRWSCCRTPSVCDWRVPSPDVGELRWRRVGQTDVLS